MESNLSAYILCGGKSSRMKTEKGLVQFQGKTFVQWIVESLAPLVPNPILVTKNPDYSSFNLEMIPDLIENQGPLGGIYTALAHSSTELVLILSCDIPKITSEILTFLQANSAQDSDKITFLSDGENDYPLIGIYPKKYMNAVENSILKGELKLRSLVESLPYRRLILNPTKSQSLQNINTPVQLLSLS